MSKAMLRHFMLMLLALAFVLGAFIFLTNPFLGIPGVDSSIFYYVASRLSDGAMPYRDVFDQKGVLLYWIDWLVAWNVRVNAMTGGWCWAAWLMDVGAYLIGFVFLWRCVRIVFGAERLGDIALALCVSSVYYHLVVIGGNMPEMWILVFSALAYSLVLQALRDRSFSSLSAFVSGLCVALVLFLKLNMVVVAVPVGIVLLCGFRRGFCSGIKMTFAFVVGLILGITPFVVWLGVGDALGSLWEVYVQYNALYATHAGRHLLITRASVPIFGILMLNVFAVSKERNDFYRKVLWVNFIYIFVVFSGILLSGGGVRYFAPVIPAIVVPLTWGVIFVRRKVSQVVNARLSLGVSALCLLALMGMVVLRNFHAGDIKKPYSELRELRKEIRDNGSVTVLGCDCYAYFVLGVTCPGRFPFQGTVAGRSEKYKADMLADLKNGKSRYLVAPAHVLDVPGEMGVAWAKTVIANQYRVVAASPSYDLYEWRPRTGNEAYCIYH